jgi:hypothetical protein
MGGGKRDRILVQEISVKTLYDVLECKRDNEFLMSPNLMPTSVFRGGLHPILRNRILTTDSWLHACYV